MIRGGHLDLCVLGAFQVAENGDIANWATSENDTAPAVGGAMDLAAGAKRLWVTMEHTTKDGQPKLVQKCSYPLTAVGAVKRVYTNLAVIDVTERGFVLRDMVEGLDFDVVADADRREAASGTDKLGHACSAAHPRLRIGLVQVAQDRRRDIDDPCVGQCRDRGRNQVPRSAGTAFAPTMTIRRAGRGRGGRACRHRGALLGRPGHAELVRRVVAAHRYRASKAAGGRVADGCECLPAQHLAGPRLFPQPRSDALPHRSARDGCR